MPCLSLGVLEVRRPPTRCSARALSNTSDPTQDSEPDPDDAGNEDGYIDVKARGKFQVVYQANAVCENLKDHLTQLASPNGSELQVFFLDALPQGVTFAKDDESGSGVKSLTDALRVRPDFVLNFLSSEAQWPSSLGTAVYKTWEGPTNNSVNRTLSSIEGFYEYSIGSTKYTRVQVWFRHNLSLRSSTYIVHNLLDEHTHELVEMFKSHVASGGYELCDAMSIDYLVAKIVADNRQPRIREIFTLLVHYECTPPDNATATHELHDLVQNIHVLRGEMNGIVEKVDSLIGICDLLKGEPCTVRDSLEHLRSSTHGWQRWLQNFAERTNIRIQLGFHLSNTKVAELTSVIALQTQRDSSSMITIAALTLLFLPGTFIASIFSMAFFEKGPLESLSVTKDIWLYPVTAIPFTLLVVFVWIAWRRRREAKKDAESSAAESSALRTTPLVRRVGTRPIVDGPSK